MLSKGWKFRRALVSSLLVVVSVASFKACLVQVIEGQWLQCHHSKKIFAAWLQGNAFQFHEIGLYSNECFGFYSVQILLLSNHDQANNVREGLIRRRINESQVSSFLS